MHFDYVVCNESLNDSSPATRLVKHLHLTVGDRVDLSVKRVRQSAIGVVLGKHEEVWQFFVNAHD